ncbi:hypothetical protein SAMN06297468_0075 [Altererythrobacter xiamenensis]|uniref:Uncharacterized protein n=1 Tax=Altererythrobacter xiamenensis TaxID=1316679 RepID=A0A1Y6E9J5_9SPHN|nr:hypothetical protein [Altererythrobacter xiamenensis]SMQ57901.1 hypothetical protein SAMN06297468_0075 [Altererythrobacter xiamenensis]
MMNVFALLAPLALMLPLSSPSDAHEATPQPAHLDPKFAPILEAGLGLQDRTAMDAIHEIPVQNQVRIEQRVIVRISPRRNVSRQSLAADASQVRSQRYEERKMDKCIPVERIAGVQTGSGNRLLLFLRDRRIVTASLEKSCRARDFYSGFYLERNEDGKLCADRDKLQSRSGANCEIDRLRQLVAVAD